MRVSRRVMPAAVTVAALVSVVVAGPASASATTALQWGSVFCGSGQGQPLPKPLANRDLVRVAGGDDHALWLTATGEVAIQGTSVERPPGQGYCYDTPKKVAGLTDITKLAAGRSFSLALRRDGTVMAWGMNDRGQLGDGTTGTRGEPRPVPGLSGVQAIAAGNDHGLALLADGSVFAWGGNSRGQLGDGTTTQRLSPVQVNGLTGATTLAAGGYHSLAITGDRQVRAWGANQYGQLGDGTTTDRPVPTPAVNRFGQNLILVNQIAAGLMSSAAISDFAGTGRVYTWGSQTYGQLGNGSTGGVQPHADGLNMPPVDQISVGTTHTVALAFNGDVYAWGANSFGQVGNNKLTGSEPYPVRTIGPLCCTAAFTVGAAGYTSFALS